MTQGEHDPAARVGTTLARKYRLNRVLGAGGMGAVYEAENLGTGRRVAVKLMLGHATTNAELAARFLREARIASRVVHPNIVEVLDLDRDPDDNTHYIVQEFLVGRELGDALSERVRYDVRDAVDIIMPVMRALVSAHAQNVVHRDLKPANIFLTTNADGVTVPKVIDFGIAKLTGEDAGDTSAGLSLTRTGAAMGTPYYMSPEQARGAKDVDAQTDVWAIGVVLYEMLSGRRPFDGETYGALIMAMTEPPPRLETVAPRVPVDVCNVIHRALTLDRTVRFATMQQFHDALAQAAGIAPRASNPSAVPAASTTGESRLRSSADALNTTLGQSVQAVTIAPTGSKPARSAMPLIIGGVALAAIAGGGIFLSLRSGGSTARSASAPPPAVVAPAAVAPVTTLPSTFRVSVTASPSNAAITFDGVDLGASSITRELPRDGTLHRLTVSAAGFLSQTIAFQDSAPQEHIELVAAPAAPATPAVAAAPPAPAGSTTHRTSTTRHESGTPGDSRAGGAIHPRGSQVQRDYVE